MSSLPEVPAVVSRALRFSLERGYLQATRSETGRLLAALAATRSGTIAECGTGCGVGAAWLRTGAPANTKVITAELNGDLAHGVMDLFADLDIDVVHADWKILSDHAPFSLLFIDAGTASDSSREEVIALLDVGGIIVVDDFVPSATWPPMTEGRVDTLRQEWLTDERFCSVDVMVTEDASVLIAVKRQG